jgi:hypothetical protein
VILGEKGPVEVGVSPSGPLRRRVAQSAQRVAERVAKFLAHDKAPGARKVQQLNAGFFMLERMRQKRGPRVKGMQAKVRSGK